MEFAPLDLLKQCWDEEAKGVWRIFPPTIFEEVPVSLVIYQPFHTGGEAVYLRQQGPLRYKAGPVLREAMISAGADHPWEPQFVEVGQRGIDEYRGNPQTTREKIFASDRQHFRTASPSCFDEQTLAIRVHTPLQCQSAIPSPLYHHEQFWWKRLPRFGLVYSINESLLKAAEQNRDAADRFLFICAVGLGNRVLAIRLRQLVLEERQYPIGDGVDLDDVARSICMKKNSNPDAVLYMVIRLLLCHHFFFVQSPRVLQLLRHFRCDPYVVLAMHGWPSTRTNEMPLDVTVGTALDELLSDLIFLLEACVRRDRITTPPDDAVRPTIADVRDAVERAMYKGLALLAGATSFCRDAERDVEAKRADAMMLVPPEELIRAYQEKFDSALSVLALPRDFLNSTTRSDKKGAKPWCQEFLMSLGIKYGYPSEDKRVQGRTKFPVYVFFPGFRQKGESQINERMWELLYLRARCANEYDSHSRIGSAGEEELHGSRS